MSRRSRPVIGLVTQSVAAIPGERSASWIFSRKYVEVVAAMGAIPWAIPVLDDASTLQEIFVRLDGVMLTGGADVDPASYGEVKQSYCKSTHPDRDAVELDLIRFARETRKPILGICRGLQILNVAFGGTLYQDIREQVPAALKHDKELTADSSFRTALVHEVNIKPGTRLYQMLGTSHVAVNSLHHQAIKDLGDGLNACAWSPDGIIEGIESTQDDFILGIQWHPEELMEIHPGMRQLFLRFMEQAMSQADRQT